MCGIAGLVELAGDRPACGVVESMLLAIAHRGPDASNVVSDERASLGTTRLALVDEGSSGQPMVSSDGRFVLCFNGEIFNYLELRKVLARKGVRFRTHGDTEVVLHSLILLGHEALALFNGQFALALYDRRSGKLLLSRDRLGILPLYYRRMRSVVAFASEVKAFQQVARLRSSGIQVAQLADLFVLWGQLPGESLFEGVRQVKPGHWLEVEGRTFLESPYWSPIESIANPQDSVADDRIGEALETAVRLRLSKIADTAVLLSGGLDSTAVAAIASRHGERRSYGVSFEDPDFDESAAQLMVAEHYGLKHKVLSVDGESILGAIPDMVHHAETPLTRMAPVATMLLSKKMAGDHVRVALTGEGADELFLGYDIFKSTMQRAVGSGDAQPGFRLAELPQSERPSPIQLGPLHDSTGSQHPYFSHLPRWHSGKRLLLYMSAEAREVAIERNYSDLLGDHFPPEAIDLPVVRRAQLLEMLLFLPTMLLASQSDRALMANSIEGRFPFLDAQLVDLVLSAPTGALLPIPVEKALLRRSLAEFIPESLRSRPKRAYTAPIQDVLRGSRGIEQFEALLSPSSLRETGLFDPVKVKWLWDRAQGDARIGGEDQRILLFIITTQVLQQRLIA